MLSTIPAKKSAVAHKNAIVPPPLKQKKPDKTITNIKRWLRFILVLAFIDNVLVWYVLFNHL